MPGLSFLSKKKWHPSRTANEKLVFAAEQEAVLERQRDAERREEVRREVALQQMEERGERCERDPRTAALRFMYAQPETSPAKSDALSNEGRRDGGEVEDAHVERFRARLLGETRQSDGAPSATSSARDDTERSRALAEKEAEQVRRMKSSSSFSANAKQSALERIVGTKHSLGQTQAEMEERHPRLKNAPVQGTYAKGVQLKHKPFADVVRNVRCLRCQTWGHQSGDRECPAGGDNPLDGARQLREDPLTSMHRGVIADARYSGTPYDLVSDQESDPEADFLATMTSREKKKLLQSIDRLGKDEEGGLEERRHHHKSSKRSKKAKSAKREDQDD